MLTEIESFRALARYAPDAVSRLPAVLDQIDLIDLGPTIRILAQTAKPLTVRSLDAIHLGTALHSRSGLTSFVTYDKRLLEAAKAAGLPVDSPAQQQPATPQPGQPAPGTDENPPLSSGWYRHAVMNPADAPSFFAGGQRGALPAAVRQVVRAGGALGGRALGRLAQHHAGAT